MVLSFSCVFVEVLQLFWCTCAAVQQASYYFVHFTVNRNTSVFEALQQYCKPNS